MNKANEVAMVVRSLPDDAVRCAGVGSDIDGWRDGCDVCLRRLSPATRDFVSYIAPPPIIEFQCEYLIDV